MDKRPVRVARALADQGIDTRRRTSLFVFIAAILTVFAIGLLRTVPAYASPRAVSKVANQEAVRKYDEDGNEADVVVLQDEPVGGKDALRVRHRHGTLRDGTGRTGVTKRTDGTGRHVATGKTGNTAYLTDGAGKTGRTGDTAVNTDGRGDTVRTGGTVVTDGTGKTYTGRTGNTCGQLTDGGGRTGAEGNTGYWTDGFNGDKTGVDGNTVAPTDGRG